VNRRDWPSIHDIKGQAVNKFAAKECHALIAKTVGISGLERGRPALYHHCGNIEDRYKVALKCFNVVFSTPDCVYDMDTFKKIKFVDIPNWGKLKENCKGWISFQPNQRMESSLVQTHVANYEASSKLKKAEVAAVAIQQASASSSEPAGKGGLEGGKRRKVSAKAVAAKAAAVAAWNPVKGAEAFSFEAPIAMSSDMWFWVFCLIICFVFVWKVYCLLKGMRTFEISSTHSGAEIDDELRSTNEMSSTHLGADSPNLDDRNINIASQDPDDESRGAGFTNRWNETASTPDGPSTQQQITFAIEADFGP
jgi:hypothetical protein